MNYGRLAYPSILEEIVEGALGFRLTCLFSLGSEHGYWKLPGFYENSIAKIIRKGYGTRGQRTMMVWRAHEARMGLVRDEGGRIDRDLFLGSRAGKRRIAGRLDARQGTNFD